MQDARETVSADICVLGAGIAVSAALEAAKLDAASCPSTAPGAGRPGRRPIIGTVIGLFTHGRRPSTDPRHR
jgi:hypothetical protein